MGICPICGKRRHKIILLRVEGDLSICNFCHPLYFKINLFLTEFIDGLFDSLAAKEIRILTKKELICRLFVDAYNFVSDKVDNNPDHRHKNYIILSFLDVAPETFELITKFKRNENEKLRRIKYWSVYLAYLINKSKKAKIASV